MKRFGKYIVRLRVYKKHRKSYLLSLISYLFLSLPFASSAQLLDSLELDTLTGATSIEQAMIQPESVIKLELIKNGLKTVPEQIRQLTNLQYLDLSRNKLTELPGWIGELKNLQFLILSRNKIETLPYEFGNLTHLKYFIMNRSGLTSLPAQIGYLKELKDMDLWDDNISSFPGEIKKLSGNLQTLDLRDVLISEDEKAMLQSCLPNTKIYFSPSCPCEQ